MHLVLHWNLFFRLSRWTTPCLIYLSRAELHPSVALFRAFIRFPFILLFPLDIQLLFFCCSHPLFLKLSFAPLLTTTAFFFTAALTLSPTAFATVACVCSFSSLKFVSSSTNLSDSFTLSCSSSSKEPCESSFVPCLLHRVVGSPRPFLSLSDTLRVLVPFHHRIELVLLLPVNLRVSQAASSLLTLSGRHSCFLQVVPASFVSDCACPSTAIFTCCCLR